VNTIDTELALLDHFVRDNPKLVVLTGAGISQASGIPTYRDHAGRWLSRTPIQHQDFLRDARTRRRYWVRSYYGWPLVEAARPNDAHRALATLEERGHVQFLITQNVDRLHQQAGSRAVVDLHGRIDQVRCLSCDATITRGEVQAMLQQDNAWPASVTQSPRPDGDMDVPDDLVDQLALPHCKHCDGDLMPDVVFFGGNVPRATVTQCTEALEQADALLVIGSSLTVFSGFRFCRHAHRQGKPIAIINPGSTRADELATLRLHSPAEHLLDHWVTRARPLPRQG
jgi:NAD-dependent SIR2 family protein deacetylase